MTNQHRATPEQWVRLDKWSTEDISLRTVGAFSCLLELRARIELLEATQHAHVDTSRLSETAREQIGQELSRPAAWQPLKIATETTYGTAPIVLPNSSASLTSSPAGSLLERVQAVCDDKPLGHEARAAILEVAAWLVEQAPEPGPIGKWLGQISTPFAVMADMLRDEANR